MIRGGESHGSGRRGPWRAEDATRHKSPASNGVGVRAVWGHSACGRRCPSRLNAELENRTAPDASRRRSWPRSQCSGSRCCRAARPRWCSPTPASSSPRLSGGTRSLQTVCSHTSMRGVNEADLPRRPRVELQALKKPSIRKSVERSSCRGNGCAASGMWGSAGVCGSSVGMLPGLSEVCLE